MDKINIVTAEDKTTIPINTNGITDNDVEIVRGNVPLDGLDLLTDNKKRKNSASSNESNINVSSDDSDSDFDNKELPKHTVKKEIPINNYDNQPSSFKNQNIASFSNISSNNNNMNDFIKSNMSSSDASVSDESDSGGTTTNNSGFNFNMNNNDDDDDDDDDDEEYEEQHQPTYEEIQQEKQSLIFKMGRLEKMGFKPTRNYTMASNIEDIRFEFERLKKMRDVDKSIKFQRKMLMAFTSGIEYLNNKFDPLDAKLDGWSEHCMESIDDYDEVFEELHDKYSDRIKMAPELKLLMMVGGSAVMFHLTNTLFKSSMPSLNDILKQNPDIMRNISQAAANNVKDNYNPSQPDPLMSMMMGGLNMNANKYEQQTRNMNMAGPPMTPPNNQPRMAGPGEINDLLTGADMKDVKVLKPKIRARKQDNSINIDF